MNFIIPILYFGIIILLMISIPTLISYFPSRWLLKKGYKKLGIVIFSSVFIFSSYSAFTAFYPSNSHFKEIFEEQTNLKFPKSGDFIFKRTSPPPGVPGGYNDEAIFKTNHKDFEDVLHSIRSNQSFVLFNRWVVKELIDEHRCYLKNIEKNHSFSICFKKHSDEILIDESWD